MSAELHVASHDLVVVRFLYFNVQQPEIIRSDGEVNGVVAGSYLVSPLETKPMLSSGSCLTGLSLSHGVDDLRVKGGGSGPAIFYRKAVNHLLHNQHDCNDTVYVHWKLLPCYCQPGRCRCNWTAQICDMIGRGKYEHILEGRCLPLPSSHLLQ